MSQFRYVASAQEIIFGPGAIARLGEAVERFRWKRLLLCATGSSRRSGRIERLETALGARLVAIYERVEPHVPDFQVAEAVTLAADRQVDSVIGLGGGSPIGLAKAVSWALEAKRTGAPAAPGQAPPTAQPLIPVVAIPTTYAGSEMTAVYGVTRQVDGARRKMTVADPRIAPKLVIYDPELTLDLPPGLTASTGINALAHCLEALYSVTRHPLSTVAALEGVRRIVSALPRCHAAGGDLEARTEMLAGAHLAGAALASVAMGLHHGLCHVLGGTAGVPHGVANSIILPHAIRFNADAVGPQLLPAAEALGVAAGGHSPEAVVTAAAEKIAGLIGRLQLPQRLRDAGVNEADLPALAQLAFQNRTVQNNPKPITQAAQIEAVLRAAW